MLEIIGLSWSLVIEIGKVATGYGFFRLLYWFLSLAVLQWECWRTNTHRWESIMGPHFEEGSVLLAFYSRNFITEAFILVENLWWHHKLKKSKILKRNATWHLDDQIYGSLVCMIDCPDCSWWKHLKICKAFDILPVTVCNYLSNCHVYPKFDSALCLALCLKAKGGVKRRWNQCSMSLWGRRDTRSQWSMPSGPSPIASRPKEVLRDAAVKSVLNAPLRSLVSAQCQVPLPQG